MEKSFEFQHVLISYFLFVFLFSSSFTFNMGNMTSLIKKIGAPIRVHLTKRNYKKNYNWLFDCGINMRSNGSGTMNSLHGYIKIQQLNQFVRICYTFFYFLSLALSLSVKINILFDSLCFCFCFVYF